MNQTWSARQILRCQRLFCDTKPSCRALATTEVNGFRECDLLDQRERSEMSVRVRFNGGVNIGSGSNAMTLGFYNFANYQA